MKTAKTGAENIRWNLTDLFPSEDALHHALIETQQNSIAFAERYRGRIADLTPRELADMMQAWGRLLDTTGKAYTFAYLHWVTATNEAARGALLQKVKEAYTAINQQFIFVETEWAALGDEKAQGILEDPSILPYRHFLEVRHLQKRYLLSEPEEKILAEKYITGSGAWERYFDEVLGAAEFVFRGETVTEQEVLTYLSHPNRTMRKDAAASLTEGLKKHSHTLTFIFNTILADKASTDRLRGYSSWISSRNMSNEIEDETVQTLIDAVTNRYPLVERFYKLKARLLGLEKLMDYDRYAPIGEAERIYSWQEAKSIVLKAYTNFHPEMGDIARKFFEERWIDAPVVAGKRGGAFSHGAVPSAHPYIMMNFTGRVRDVQTLAHELGHGVHQYLSRKQGVFHADTPLTTAETASVFGEMLTFQYLMQLEQDPKSQLRMLVSKIDDTFATVFRQITMNRFEDRIHTLRRTKGELSTEEFSHAWMTTQTEMFGESVELGEHYSIWWSYIPHFLHSPGYVYAYAFGELLVLALYSEFMNNPHNFADRYLNLLSAGGSDWPNVLLQKMNINLQDPNFWNKGLDAIQAWIEQAEALA